MKNIRRYIAVASFITVSCSLMVGCKKSTQSNNQAKVQISILAKNSWYTNVDYADSEIVNTVIQNSGYNVNWKLNPPSNYYDTVRPLLLEKNNLADIVQVPDLDANADYIHTGEFIKLDEYMDSMPNFRKYLEENPAIKASLTAEDGHIYYVPQTVHTNNYQPCIMYNMEWLKKLGLNVPSTLDEFVQVLKAFKNSDMNGNGIADEVPLSITADFIPYMFGPAFGLDLVSGFYADDNGIVHCSYYEDNYKDYLQFLNQLYSDGLLEIDYNSITRDTIIERCKENRTGVTFDFSWQMSSLYSAQYAEYDGTKPVFCGAPPLSGKYTGYYIGRNEISGLFGVMTSSDKILDSVKFLDYVMSEEAQQYYCWGIEGESYYIDNNGKKEFTEKAKDDTWLQKLGINPGCLPSRQSVEAVDNLLPKWHSDVDKQLTQYIKSPFPFIFATSLEKETDHGYTDYIAQYVSHEGFGFITGKLSLDSFDFYIKTLKSMNIDSVIKVKQNQYNRYIQAYK